MLFKKTKKFSSIFEKKTFYSQKIKKALEDNKTEISVIQKDFQRNNPYIKLEIKNCNSNYKVEAFYALGKWNLFNIVKKINEKNKINILYFLYKNHQNFNELIKTIYSEEDIIKKILYELLI